MRLSLTDDLRCPCCLSEIQLQVIEQNADGSIQTGIISSTCGERFPIIGGIPRMLLGPLRRIVFADYPERISELAAELGTDWSVGLANPNEDVEAKRRTAASFGYEWNQFSTLLPVYQANFDWYVEPLGKVEWDGIQVLDAGCGTGRHSYHAASRGARVIGVDLSRAIDVAAANNRGFPNVDFIQADLCQLPLRRERFELVYSLGVLHHLPDPRAGFRSLAQMVVPGGRMLIYVYWSLEGEPRWKRGLLRTVTLLRRWTTRLPHDQLKLFSLIFSAACYAGLVAPGRVLGGRDSMRWLPLSFYRDYPLRVLYNDTFDRFSAPIENRYDSETIRAWFEGEGLRSVDVQGGAGWRVAGQR